MDPSGLILITLWDDLQWVRLALHSSKKKKLSDVNTSIISSRGNSRKGMSAALQAIR